MKILTMNAMPKETKGSFPFYDSLLGRKTSNNRENRKKINTRFYTKLDEFWKTYKSDLVYVKHTKILTEYDEYL